LDIGIDQLGEEDPVERGVLADKYRLASLDPIFLQKVGDLSRDDVGPFSLLQLIISEAIDAQARGIALGPDIFRLMDDRLVRLFDLSRLHIDDLECDLQDAMLKSVQPIGLCIEKDSKHDPPSNQPLRISR